LLVMLCDNTGIHCARCRDGSCNTGGCRRGMPGAAVGGMHSRMSRSSARTETQATTRRRSCGARRVLDARGQRLRAGRIDSVTTRRTNGCTRPTVAPGSSVVCTAVVLPGVKPGTVPEAPDSGVRRFFGIIMHALDTTRKDSCPGSAPIAQERR
jgi:hypothetical protein